MRKSVRVRWIVAAAVVVFGASVASAETFYVDVEWEGPSRGEAEAPFNTLGQAVEAYVKAGGGTVRVAGGLYKSTRAGGKEDFGEEGYMLRGRQGEWLGGYGGWDGERFDWTDEGRALPDADNVDEGKMTVVDLTGANARAFHLAEYAKTVRFNGFVFRNSEVTRKDYPGGALLLAGGMSAASVHHCLFLNNRTTGPGGGLRLSGRGGTSTHCTFIGNRSDAGGGGASVNPGNGSQTLQHFRFKDNRADAGGGGLEVPSYHVRVLDSAFEGNTAGGLGGAVSGAGHADLERCRIVGNRAADGAAAGFEAHTGANFTFTNCLFVGNAATDEGGRLIHSGGGHGGGNATLAFCTIADNNTPGGAVVANATLRARHCIVVGDGRGQGLRANRAAALHRNLVHNFASPYAAKARAGDDALDGDPRFRDPEAGDYRPEMHSPAVNAAVDPQAKVDIDGNPRPYNAKDLGVDLGCHEIPPVPRDTVLLLR